MLRTLRRTVIGGKSYYIWKDAELTWDGHRLGEKFVRPNGRKILAENWTQVKNSGQKGHFERVLRKIHNVNDMQSTSNFQGS